ncbi:MAG TPA: sugar transferase [Desulfotomaculum sp.]|nr:sugar transferase [Desulfotomaculum sp.]
MANNYLMTNNYHGSLIPENGGLMGIKMFRLRAIKPVLSYLLAVGDLLLVVAGFFLAFSVRFPKEVPVVNWQPFIQIAPWVGIATLILFAGLGLYGNRHNGLTLMLRGVITGIVGVMIVTMALTFWFRGFAFPRSVLILAALIQVLMICVWRYFFWHVERWLYGQRQLLVIGHSPEVTEVLGRLFNLPRGWFKVRQVLPPERLNELPAWLFQVDAVLIVPSLSREDKATVLTACLEARREAYVVPDLYDIMLSHGNMLQLDDLPVVEVQDIRLSWLQRATKRTMDLTVAGLGLLLLLPVVLACALVVAITSPGPIFYLQERVGFRGRPFLLYKFRTMAKDAENLTGPVLADEQDPRITRAGRFLRAVRLDELPQLINVLKGNMSIVGPRPERPFFVEQFLSKMPDYRYRYLVKPGLTGMAQVYGKYTTSAADKLRYDLYYIRNYSLLLDLKIVLQTIPVALGGEAARGLSSKTDSKKEAVIHALVNDVVQQTATGKEG